MKNETNKMLEIIHENRNKTYMKNIQKREETQKKDKIQRRIEISILLSLFIIVMILYGFYNDRQIKNCIDQGGSENFCKYAGK